jgi:hypothetical protein
LPRPYIDFIQQQDLPFEKVNLGSDRGESRLKRLSVDAETGASSNLIAFSAGWRRREPSHVLADQDLYVLSGDLTLSGVTYTEHSYAFLPSGYTRADSYSERGALVLTFNSAAFVRVPGEAPSGSVDEARLVRCVNLVSELWTGDFQPQFPVGAGRKWLRRDPVTGDDTWILGTLPLRNERRAGKHPVVEELYLISGELIGPRGVMRPGAYFWRPPDLWHGPYGSKTGCLMLVRTVGGPLSTVYADEEQEFDWNPEGYRPILPPELAAKVSRSGLARV